MIIIKISFFKKIGYNKFGKLHSIYFFISDIGCEINNLMYIMNYIILIIINRLQYSYQIHPTNNAAC